MVNIKDRSNEFSSILSSIRRMKKINPVYPVNRNDIDNFDTLTSTSTPTPTPTTFTDNASRIRDEITMVMDKLSSLQEIQTSSSPTTIDQIKKEISSLQLQITYLQQRKEGPPTSYQNTIIIQLQTSLAQLSQSFSAILESKQAKLRNERQRREEFSAAPNILAHSSSLKGGFSAGFGGAGLSTNNNNNNNNNHSSFDFSSSMNRNNHQTSSSSSLLQISQLREEQPLIEDQYRRSEALQGIETTINDLGHIYQRLATMIGEQGEQVQRIDMNINEMHYNVQRGQSQLLTYLNRMKSNRMLMIKMFAALFVFILIFSLIKSV